MVKEEKKYQVFISSTFVDLKEERKVLQDHLLTGPYVPVGMETFLGSRKTLPQYLKDLIDSCDYYVVIVAGRYGSKNSDGISWTELEYDYAVSTGIPVLAFFKQSNQDYADEINRFMDKIRDQVVPTLWENKDDLKARVYAVLSQTDTPRPGWVRADKLSADTKTAEKLRQMETELYKKREEYVKYRAVRDASEKDLKERLFVSIQRATNLQNQLDQQIEIAQANAARAAELEQEIADIKARSPRLIEPLPEVGDTYSFGSYEWLVLDVQEDRALLITKDIIERRAYHDENKDVKWESCSLRQYLNEEFFDSFGVAKKRILQTENLNPATFYTTIKGRSVNTPGGNPTTDHIFLLSVYEANKYFHAEKKPAKEFWEGQVYLDSLPKKIPQSNAMCASGPWRLRSSGSGQNATAVVEMGGAIYFPGWIVPASIGVRPALWLNFAK